MTQAEARWRLDRYYAEMLGQEAERFYQPGICLTTLLIQPPSSSLFRKSILILHMPATTGSERSCLLVAHPRLIEPLRPWLSSLKVPALLEEATLAWLTHLVHREFPTAVVPSGGLSVIARFVTQETFHPFRGPELARVKRLNEHHLANLALFGRYSGGIYALHDEQGQILSRAGIRYESRDVWEIGVRTEVEALRGRGLAKTVVTAATEAILAAGRVPLYVHSATNLASEKVALALGYQQYATECIWSLPQ